jgi:hypothetical protein
MCEKCVEIDKKIAHYERLASRFTDQALLDGIKELIEQAKAQSARSTSLVAVYRFRSSQTADLGQRYALFAAKMSLPLTYCFTQPLDPKR